MSTVVKDLEDYKVKNEILSGTVKCMSGVIKEMNTRITNLELNNMIKSIIITSFMTARNKELCIVSLNGFFYQEMSLQPDIVDVFYLTPQGTSPMVITLADMQQKIEIFQNVHKVKDLVNEDGNPFFFNDYLPAELNERKRMERDIFCNNKQLDEDDRIDMEMKGGRLKINGKQYEEKIQVPSDEYILSMSPTEINQTFSVSLAQGDRVSKMNSQFIGYSLQVNKLDDIQKAYTKVKLMHNDARHVICVYCIPGNVPRVSENCCDDGEYAAGRTLLNWLRSNELSAVAVFVVRYYGGNKMGPARFTCIVDAAKSVIRHNPNLKLTPQALQPKVAGNAASTEHLENEVDTMSNDSSFQLVTTKRTQRNRFHHFQGDQRGLHSRKMNKSLRRGSHIRQYVAARGRGASSLGRPRGREVSKVVKPD